MSPVSDEALFERFRTRGDAGALGELFDRAAPALLRIALHLARDPAAAEDLVQATFLKAIEARATWEGRRPVMPWLCGILQNRARSAQRIEERTPDPFRLASQSPIDPARAAEAAEFDAAVDSAIAALPEPYQPVLRLHLAYGHVPAEIAHALSRPPGTVRSQLARGLELLRKTLPVGLTAAMALSLSTGRGFAAVRACVLGEAAAVTPLAPLVGTVTGAALAMKSVVSVFGLLVFAGLAWIAWPRTQASMPREVAQENAPERAQAALDPISRQEPKEEDDALSERVALTTPSIVTTGVASITCRWEDDGSLASGVMLTVTPASGFDGELRARTGITGADGKVQVADLPAGEVQVTADRGGASSAEIVAGLTVETELTIPRGVNVRGRVVDEHDAPVPLAQIWLSIHARNYSDGRYVMTADAVGRFDLRSVETGRFLSAVARGWRAAVVEPVQGEAGSTVDVELVLRGSGATLLGSVSGPDGAPLAGARVVVGFREVREGWSRGMHANYRPPPELETDARGAFRADGLEPGSKVEVWVRAVGSCPWFEWVELGTDAVTTVAVQLQRGASVSGRVTDDGGNPVPGAWLVARSTAWFSRGVDLDDLYAPDWVRVRAETLTDADGNYELAELTPGTQLLRASTKDRVVRDEVAAADGERVTWSPVLTECAVHGRLVDARGMPLVGWRVSGTPPRSEGDQVGDTTDSEGKFRWQRCTDVSYRLHARTGDDELGALPFTLHRVRPSATDLLVQIPDSAIPSAAIEGTLLDSDGQAREKAEVLCQTEGLRFPMSVDVDPSTGRFRIAPLTAGIYQLQGCFDSGDSTRRSNWTEPITLAANESRDVGLLQMPQSGTVVATVYGADGALLDGAAATVGESSSWGEILWPAGKTDHGILRIADLAPGVHKIAIRGRELPSVYREVTVTAGEETRAEITVPAGVRCRIHFPSLTDAAPIHFTFVWTRDGAPWERYVNLWEGNGELSYSTTILPGTYVVTITSETGKQAVNRFVISPSDPAEREIPITLP